MVKRSPSGVKPSSRSARLAVSCLLLIAALPSCEKVWGIEAARLDPVLGAGGEPGSTASAACQAYCSAVTDNCTDKNAQYGDLKTCLDVCAAIPEGTPGDIGVNTVQCRLKMAESAPAEPESFCTAAGPAGELPGGSNGCGTACDGLCTLMMTFCTDHEAAKLAYANVQACYEDCRGLPDRGAFSLAPDSGSASGPAVQCRIYHASAASQLASLHCEHAMGASPCL